MSPRYWWLRSPNVGYSTNTRTVNTTGNVNNNNANNSNGISPDCVYSPFIVRLLLEQKSEHHKQGTIIPFCENRQIKNVDVIYYFSKHH